MISPANSILSLGDDKSHSKTNDNNNNLKKEIAAYMYNTDE